MAAAQKGGWAELMDSSFLRRFWWGGGGSPDEPLPFPGQPSLSRALLGCPLNPFEKCFTFLLFLPFPTCSGTPLVKGQEFTSKVINFFSKVINFFEVINFSSKVINSFSKVPSPPLSLPPLHTAPNTGITVGAHI